MTPACRKLLIACSTFRQAVFCTRTAPTMISTGESPGHQRCGPNFASIRSYASISFVDIAIDAGDVCESPDRRYDSTKVKSENGPKNELAKSALLLFFGAIIIELVRVGVSVAVLAVTRFL